MERDRLSLEEETKVEIFQEGFTSENRLIKLSSEKRKDLPCIEILKDCIWKVLRHFFIRLFPKTGRKKASGKAGMDNLNFAFLI